jgi:dTMP kinase
VHDPRPANSPLPPDWLRHLAGRFIVFEGPDGSGKSTQLRRFTNACKSAAVPICEVREPGGTGVGERIRDILLDHAHKDMSLRCEMMLYMASRAQLVEQRIRPALQRGELVIADRFVSSTIAYQGSAGGLPIDEIMAVARVATGGFKPDLVVIFDVDERTASARLSPLLDRMEAKGREFHAKVRQGYLQQVRDDPAGHLCVDASMAEDDVWRTLMAGLRHRLLGAKGA